MNGADALCFLDVGPFRSILIERLNELKEVDFILDPNAQLSQEAGIGERPLRRILNSDQDSISFDHADKIVTNILGPMAWHEDKELNAIYMSVDLNRLDWGFPVSEKVRGEFREKAVRYIRELGTVRAAHRLGISTGTVSRYAREARAKA